jgi:hypothetical protein
MIVDRQTARWAVASAILTVAVILLTALYALALRAERKSARCSSSVATSATPARKNPRGDFVSIPAPAF